MIEFDNVFHNEDVREVITDNFSFAYCPILNEHSDSTYEMSGWTIQDEEGYVIDCDCWERMTITEILESSIKFEKLVKKYCSEYSKQIIEDFRKYCKI